MMKLQGLVSHQSQLRRDGGCWTGLQGSRSCELRIRKVKALGNFLLWSILSWSNLDVHILAVYIQPGSAAVAQTRIEKVVAIANEIL
jgi:hypothetical protein